MDAFEIKDILDSFEIICDTREQNTPKADERYKAFGVPYQKATLGYGDYCGNIILPERGSLYNTSTTIQPAFVIERKNSLDELAMCFTRDRNRFRKEFERAAEHGARMILLVENATWEAIDAHRYRSRFTPAAFNASLTAWTIRYNITPIFCKADSSGKRIKEFLYRDMKERLEGGEFG